MLFSLFFSVSFGFLSSEAMRQQRFAPAAAAVAGKLYVCGGADAASLHCAYLFVHTVNSYFEVLGGRP